MKKKSKILLLCLVFLIALLSTTLVAFATDSQTTAERLLGEISTTPPTVSADGKSIVLPTVSDPDYAVSLYGTSNPSVIDENGNIYTPLVDTEVSVMYKVTSKADENEFATDEYKEAKIMIEGKYEVTSSDNAEPAVLPKLREWKGGTGTLKITDSSRIVVTNSRLSATAARIKEYISAITGFDMEIVVSNESAAGDIVLSYIAADELGEEGYTVELTDRVSISANAETGALYGGTTIAQMLDLYEGYELPCGHIRDYPQYSYRAVMVDVARHYIPMEYLTEITKYMAYFKVNVMRIHINDTSGQQPYAFRVESKKFPEINANLGENYYTQEEYRAYQREMLSYGIKVITEIDSPGHAGFVNAYDSTLTAPSNTSLLNLSTEIHSTVDGVDYTYYDKSVEFMKELFYEFIGGDNPVVIDEIDTFHIGMDEYTLNHEQFKVYMTEMTEFVHGLGKKTQVWSALKTDDFDSELPIGTDVTVNYWGFADFKKLIEYGFPCVANRPMDLYVVPGGFSNSFGDRINLETLYGRYTVNDIGSSVVLAPSSPLLLGAEACLWNDANAGPSLQDLFDRLHDQMLLISEKCWYGGSLQDADTAEFMSRVHKFENRVPIANPSDFVRGDENGNVADFDFENIDENTVKDKFGQYDATLNGISTVNVNGNSMLELDGNGYLSLPFKTLGHPYTVSFDLIYEGSENGILFGSDGSWLKLNFNGTGKIAYKRDMQTYTLPHVFLENVNYRIMLVCDDADVYLYVNGIFAGKGEIYSVDTYYSYTRYVTFTTLPLPTERIGEGVTGRLDNLKMYNYAMDYDELTGLNLVNYGNVAKDKEVTASGVEVTTKWGPECAVDGVFKADDNNNKTSLNNANDAWLQIDLGRVYEVEKIVIEFSQRPNAYKFLTSVDGVVWDTVHEESSLTGGSGGTDTVMLNDKEVRYVKYQTVEMFLAGNGYRYSGGFHEIEVYSSYYDNTIIEEANELVENLDGKNKEFLASAIDIVNYIVKNNDYTDAGIALKGLCDLCDKIKLGYTTVSDADRSSLIGLVKNKKKPELYSADSYNTYNEAYRFALGTVLSLTATSESVEFYSDKLEAAAFELLCPATVETNMSFDNPQNLIDGNASSYAVTSGSQTAGEYIIVRYEDVITLKSLKLIMSVGNRYLGAADLFVSYDGTEFVQVTTYNTSLALSNVSVGNTNGFNEIFFPKALYGVKAIKIVLSQDTARVAHVNEIHVNHVTDFDTVVSGISDVKEDAYTASSVKFLLPYTRSMAVTKDYMDRAKVYINYLVKRADVSEIEFEIKRLEKISSDRYTEASYARLTTEIANAKAFILAINENTNVYEGRAIVDNLLEAEDLLLLRRDGIDTSLLETEINRTPDASLYTHYSYEAYERALSSAITILYSENATQKDIDDAYSALSARYVGLKTRAAKQNVALGKVVASSGLEAASVDITKVVDGNDATSFANRVNINNADDAWISIDLGAVYTIDEFSLHWYTQPSKYCIMVSIDGNEWNTVYTNLACKSMNKQAVDSIKIEATEAKYVKFQQIQMLIGNAEKNYRYTGNITEFKVFASDMTVYTDYLSERYDELKALDSSLMHEDCAAKHIAALEEAERVLGLDAPTQAQIDAAAALLLSHSEENYVVNGPSVSFDCECGASYEKAPVTLDAAKLNINENINMIYLFTVDESVDDIRIEFIFKGKKYNCSAYTVESDGRYAFRFDRILPQYMNDRLTATVFATVDGTELKLELGGISVKEYAKKLLELYPDNEKLVTVISDLLVYGAAAQTYTSYNTANLVTNGIDIKPSEFTAPSSKLSLNEESSLTAFTTVGLKLTGDVNMYFVFNAIETEGLTLKVSINGRETLYNVSELTPEQDGSYKVYFNKIMAHETDDVVTASFLLNGEEIGNSLTYSVNSYIAAAYESSNVKLASLVKALANYGASAKAYKG